MDKKTYCEYCDKLVSIRIEKEDTIYTIKGDSIPLAGANKAYCTICSKRVLNAELEDANLRKVYLVYAKNHNLATSDEIKEVRKFYGLSQIEFAKATGIGEASIQRYEGGSLPNQSNSTLIRLVKAPGEFLKVLESNSLNIPEKLYKKIRTKIAMKCEKIEFSVKKNMSAVYARKVTKKTRGRTSNSQQAIPINCYAKKQEHSK